MALHNEIRKELETFVISRVGIDMSQETGESYRKCLNVLVDDIMRNIPFTSVDDIYGKFGPDVFGTIVGRWPILYGEQVPY